MTLTNTLDAIKETAKIKFKELGACYDEMEREHRGYVETRDESTQHEKGRGKVEQGFVRNPLYERTWQEEH